jgi:hypothetical protein
MYYYRLQINWDFFCLLDPIYLQSVIIHSANGGKGEGWHVEEYSVFKKKTNFFFPAVTWAVQGVGVGVDLRFVSKLSMM